MARRPARHRLVVGLFGLVALAATACTGSDAAPIADAVSDNATASASDLPTAADLGCEDNERWAEGIDVIVFLEADASQDDITEMERDLVASPLVERLVYVNQTEAFAEFQEMFNEQDQIRDSVQLTDMPPNFRIVVAEAQESSIELFADSYRDKPKVFSVVERLAMCVPTLENMLALCAEYNLPGRAVVFLEPSAPQSEIDRIAQVLEDSGDFSSITFVNKEQAFRDFQVMFRDAGRITASVTAEDMPVSFELDVAAPESAQPLFDELRSDVMVFEVIDDSLCDFPS